MSKKATLKIDGPPRFDLPPYLPPVDFGIWTYEDAEFEAGSEVAAESTLSGGGEFEVGSVEVRLFSETFLGAASVLEVPGAGPWRAMLDLDGETVFEGTLSRSGVSHDDDAGELRRWSLRLENTATEDFLNRLEAERLDSAAMLEALYPEAGNPYAHEAVRPVVTHLAFEDGTQEEQVVSWYDVRLLWEQFVEARLPEVTIEAEPAYFELRMPFLNSAGEERFYVHSAPPVCVMQLREEYDHTADAGPDNHTVPAWTGADLFAPLRQTHGLRVEARYAPFPSEDLFVTLQSGRWRDVPQPLPEASGLALSGGWQFGTEAPQEPDLALQYENSLFEAPLSAGAHPMPSVATAAARRWEIGADGTLQAESLNRLGVRLVQTTGEEDHVRTYAEGYEETIRRGDAVVDAEDAAPVYLAATDQISVIRWREPEHPTGELLARRSEVWATMFYPSHALAAASLHVAEAEIATEALAAVGHALQVGRTEGGLRLLGRAWMLTRLRRSEDARSAEVEMVRPTADYESDALPPPVGAPDRLGATLRVYGRDGVTYEYDLEISWGITEGGAPPDRHEVSYRLKYHELGYTAWFAVPNDEVYRKDLETWPDGRWAAQRDLESSLDLPIEIIEWRVRTAYETGYVSDFATYVLLTYLEPVF